MSDDEFFAQLRHCSLPSSQFNHQGHLRLARICLARYGLEQAIGVVCGTISAYAASLGAAGKFHWTVTEALVRLLAADPALELDAKALLARHYSAALLASDAARAHFVQPDLAPLPC
ncbi:MAG: hypothetical protein V4484_13655 [Pseudomonadota bacterium]